MMKKSLIALALLCALNFVSWQTFFYLRDDNLRVVFFDVGQGDAVFIKTPQNHHILIDGGSGDVVLEKLEKELPFFYKSIDLVILSHAHDDHVAGLIEVVERYDVDNIICTGVLGSSAVSGRWRSIIEERGYHQARAGQIVSANNFYIETLYPVENLKDREVNDLNEASVISYLVFKDNHRFIFTGDAYKAQEREVVSSREGTIRADVLKVGHHGSRTSTSGDFLREVSPRVAVIMAGKDNRYGHPHRETLEKLEDFGVKIMRTDRDGDIIFEISS